MGKERSSIQTTSLIAFPVDILQGCDTGNRDCEVMARCLATGSSTRHMTNHLKLGPALQMMLVILDRYSLRWGPLGSGNARCPAEVRESSLLQIEALGNEHSPFYLAHPVR